MVDLILEDLGQINLSPVGEIKYNPARFSTILNLIALDFPFNEEALDKISKELNEYPNLRSRLH